MDVPELLKMMEKGGADAVKLLPKMADEFHKAAIEGDALNESLQGPMAKLNKLQTDWQRFQLKFADSGALDVILKIFESLSITLGKLQPALPGIAEAFGTVFGALGKLVIILAHFINWIEQTIGLENVLYGFFAVKMVGWIMALYPALTGLIGLLKTVIATSATAAATGILGTASILKGGAGAAAVLGKAGAVGAVGLGAYALGSWFYNSFAVEIQDMFARWSGEEERIASLTKATVRHPRGMTSPTQSGKQEINVRIHLDNKMLQADVEKISGDQLLAQILKTEAAMPGGR